MSDTHPEFNPAGVRVYDCGCVENRDGAWPAMCPSHREQLSPRRVVELEKLIAEQGMRYPDHGAIVSTEVSEPDENGYYQVTAQYEDGHIHTNLWGPNVFHALRKMHKENQ